MGGKILEHKNRFFRLETLKEKPLYSPNRKEVNRDFDTVAQPQGWAFCSANAIGGRTSIYVCLRTE